MRLNFSSQPEERITRGDAAISGDDSGVLRGWALTPLAPSSAASPIAMAHRV